MKRNEQKVKELRKSLANPEAGSSEEEVLRQIMSLQEETKRIKKKLSDKNE